MHKRHAVANAKKRWQAEDQSNLLEGADYEKSSYCVDIYVCHNRLGG